MRFFNYLLFLMAPNFLALATTLENLGARRLLAKKVNFVPWTDWFFSMNLSFNQHIIVQKWELNIPYECMFLFCIYMPKMHFFSFDIQSFNLANLLFIVPRNKKHNVHGRYLTFCLVMQAARYPQTNISWLVLHLVVLVCASQRAQGLNSCNCYFV